MSSATVNAAFGVAQITKRNTDGGRAGIDGYGLGKYIIYEETVIQVPDTIVNASTGNSAGYRLPANILTRKFKCWGVPVGSTAAWDALSTDADRDNATILDDDVAPIGSEAQGFDYRLKTTGTMGGFNSAKVYGKPVAQFPQGIKLRSTATTGAPGTATIQCSSDGGTTWCTAYATVASGANVIKDSAGVDTGLRFDLTTTPNFGATDSAYHDFKVGGSTKYLKTTAATWTAL